MIHFRHSRLFQQFLALALVLATMIPTMAAANTEMPLNNDEQVNNSDTQYFQQVANKWISTDPTSDAPAVLKGAVSASGSSYRLGAGDVMIVTIPDLYTDEHSPDINLPINDNLQQASIAVVVRDQGEVSVPPFGSFHVDGMTVGQFSHMLEEMARFYLVNPRVYVSLKALRPFTVFMNGAVNRPGPYQTLNSPEQAYLAYADNAGSKLDSQQLFMGRISVMIGKAGGILPTADIEHIRVSNKSSGKDLTLNLKAMLEGDTSQDVPLEPDDVVFIPKVDRNAFESELVATSVLAPKIQVVHLLGYVNRNTGFTQDGITPDITVAPRDMFLLSALSKVNIDPRANLHRVFVFRRNHKDNSLEKFTVDATKENFALVPDDVIYVPHLRKNYQLQNIIQSVGQLLGGAGSFTQVYEHRN